MLDSYLHKNKIEVGCDEAGRGCLAGPVVAAAVILPKNFKHPFLNDSKQLSEKNRVLLRTRHFRNCIVFQCNLDAPLSVFTFELIVQDITLIF